MGSDLRATCGTVRPVVCVVCGEYVVVRLNGTYKHGENHYRSYGHRHRVVARLAGEPLGAEGQGLLGLGGVVGDGAG